MTSIVLTQQANELFNKIMMQTAMKKVVRSITGKKNSLRSYEDDYQVQYTASQSYRGTQTISIENIAGSINRENDFDADFMPKNERIKERWISIATAMYQDIMLPPITVFLIDGVYYVEDGHHRVSVAKALGYLYIDAVVTEIDSLCA